MDALALTPNPATRPTTSVPAKMLNVLASPDEVFAEVTAAPHNPANWLGPTLLAVVTGSVLAQTTSGDVSWRWVLSLGFGAFAGTCWSAFLLWFIARVFLDSRFSFVKAMEVVGLAVIIPALGAVVTSLLIVVSGDVTARPALSMFVAKLPAGNHARAVMDALNFFHLWTTTVLAIGLARLSGVSFKEAAFWVFGIWVFGRIALILLG
ncbi:MAG TPA: YIP1 family protein [Candidatus Binatia bacterium]|jgi:hypothetical protein|nr:YIP1 family protein [Candidatus Binatia bacterium]